MDGTWILRLASEFLRAHAEHLGSRGCNDYTLPDWVPLGELKPLLAAGNGGGDATGLEKYDYAVVGAVSRGLDNIAAGPDAEKLLNDAMGVLEVVQRDYQTQPVLTQMQVRLLNLVNLCIDQTKQALAQ